MTSEQWIRVALTVPETEAEGPGRRFALWVQGCPLRCPGCCNPEMLPASGGTLRAVSDLAREVIDTPGIEGLTLLGGEPLAQAAGCAALARRVQAAHLSVMLFSGWTLAELRQQAAEDAAVDRLLEATDLLVDGRYRREAADTTRRWIGSRNQRLHFLSTRYRADDPRFCRANTLEIRLADGRLTVNGWPAGDLTTKRRG